MVSELLGGLEWGVVGAIVVEMINEEFETIDGGKSISCLCETVMTSMCRVRIVVS